MSDQRAGSGVFAIVAGGGTGGHVVPAVAIGQALVERGHRPESILFVGSERGIERRLVPEAGFPLVVLPGRGIVRRVSAATVKANLEAISGILVAVAKAVGLVRRLRPSVVISVGGYASVPCVVAAKLWRRPIVVAEQNAVPGAANRLAGKFAAASAVSFPNTALPRATVTGNPVRSSVLGVDRGQAGRTESRQALDLPADAVVIAVVTGSLGARKVNQAVLELARLWAEKPPVQDRTVAVRHVIGERDWDQIRGEWEQAQGSAGGAGFVYQQVRFEDHMELVYAAADVLVGRAGASTVAELAVVGMPSILVPLPNAPGDHQTANARRMADVGAAVMLPDSDCDAKHLESAIGPLLADAGRRKAMSSAAIGLGRPDAAAAVAELVETTAGGSRAIARSGPSSRERDCGPSGRERDSGPSGRERDSGGVK